LYAWDQKGYALNALGRYEEALQACDKAIEIDPNYLYAWSHKGFALYGLGRYDEALQAYDKCIELDPLNALSWYNKGVILEALGRYDEAQVCYDKAEELGLYIEDVRYYTLNLEGSEHHTLKILNSPQRS
ncbi:tetratricopeptide repeat protein, partial [Methanomethylovorans sp.]